MMISDDLLGLCEKKNTPLTTTTTKKKINKDKDDAVFQKLHLYALRYFTCFYFVK